MIPDVVAATRTYLLTIGELTALVGTRVYGQELPRAETPLMPRKALVIQSAGGPSEINPPVGDSRLDFRCYGESALEAMKVYRSIVFPLKYMTRTAIGVTLMHSAFRESGPILMREPDTDWSFILASFRIKAAEIAIS